MDNLNFKPPETPKPLILIYFIEFLVRVLIALMSILLIVAVSYFLGYQYLQSLRGNDAMHALNNIYWFAKWWPQIPYWFTGQGAGVSILWGYPVLPSFIVILVSLWQKMSLIFSMQLVGFLSFPLTACGMYLFVWRRLKNQSVALISAILFLIMPMTWIWFYDWGFYAEQIANIFIFPSLIFYDRFLDGASEKKFGSITMFSLLLAVVFLGLSFAGHPTVYFSTIRIFGVYTPFYLIFKNKKLNLKIILTSLAITLFVFATSVFANSFLIMNYQHYSKGAILDVQSQFDKKDFEYYYSVPFKPFLGLSKIPSDDFKFTLRNMVLSPVVWIPAIVGGVLAIFISGKVFGLAFLGWFSVLTLYKPQLLYYLAVTKFPMFGYFFGLRNETLIVRIILPIIAGFGIWSGAGLIFKLLHKILKIKNQYLDWGYQTIAGIITGTLALVLALAILFKLSGYPDSLWNKDQVRYGNEPFNIRDPFNQFGLQFRCFDDKPDILCSQFSGQNKYTGANLVLGCTTLIKDKKAPEFCNKLTDLETSNSEKEQILVSFTDKCEAKKTFGVENELCPLVARKKEDVVISLGKVLTDLSYWPKPVTDNKLNWPYTYLDEFNKEYGDNQFLRVDVSPMLGGITQELNIVNKASFINLYTVQLNLLGPYWGYQQQIMFGKGGGVVETNELAKWFGTKFLLMNYGLDPIDRYESSPGWEDWKGNKYIWQYKDAPELWTLTSGKPSILVIGDLTKRAYEPLFRTANKGALPYDQFWLIDGGEYLDDYTSGELKNFDIVMLFGHKYHNRRNAYRSLDQYLKEGGNLYIDAGWQYVSADWEIKDKKPPEFFPTGEFSWKDDFTDKSEMNFDNSLIGDIDGSQFGPLMWSGTGWGVSVLGNLRSWAKPIMMVDEKVIIAGGNYGKGRVVLSGLNLIGHIHTFNYNQSELSFINAIFNWLDKPSVSDLTESVTAERRNPDKIIFTINKDVEQNTAFYFRESFFPDWRAKLISGNKVREIKIHKAGPGFKLMYLDNVKSGDKLVLAFEPGFRNTFWIITSLSTFAILIVGVFVGNRFFKFLLLKLPIINLKQIGSNVKDSWTKEED